MPQQPNLPSVLPPDIHPESLSRLSPVNRDSLTEKCKSSYDDMVRLRAEGKNLAGLIGPSGIWIRIPVWGEHVSELNHYLRHNIDLEPRLSELAILASAREMDSQFEWTMHEPEALRVGVTQEVLDVVKFRKPISGMTEIEAVIVELARETLGAKKLSSATYARAIGIFGEMGLLNLMALMANYATSAIMLTAVDQQLRPDQKPLMPVL
ncbi:MAG: carboxymuconolactone decarboxylase family protein [Burkholderiales bacterium]